MASRPRSVNAFRNSHHPPGIPRPVVLRAPPEWDKFIALCDDISNPDYELVAEDFVAFCVLFRKLCRIGVPFSPDFVAKVDALVATTRGGGDDSDDDTCVIDRGERPDDEDASDQWLTDGAGHRPPPVRGDEEDPRNWAVPVPQALRVVEGRDHRGDGPAVTVCYSVHAVEDGFNRPLAAVYVTPDRGPDAALALARRVAADPSLIGIVPGVVPAVMEPPAAAPAGKAVGHD